MSRILSSFGLRPIRRRVAILSGAACLAVAPTAANADCTADSSGVNVTCTGSSTGYSNLSSGVSLTADSTAAITGPVLLGNSAGVNNSGSITGTTGPLVQVGTSSAIVNAGTIELTNVSSGSAAVVMGDGSTFTNNGVLSASAGTPVLQFGQAGTFINNTSATAAVTGNIIFGPNISGGTSTLQNYNTAFGITGNISSIGNTSIYNDGRLSGIFVQTPTGGTVGFTNDTAGIFTGSIATGDQTNMINNGTMSIIGASTVGNAQLSTSSFTNNGMLNVGTTGSTELVVNGNFTNSASGILNIALHSNGAETPVAGTSFSQVYAAGPSGTATLGGTLNLVPTAGFYPSGSTYDVVLADKSISGNFATVNGSTLPFISFVPVGITTVGTQQAYEVMAVRSTTYAQAIASVATPSQIAIAQGLQPLVATANSDPTSTAATLIGAVDQLTIPQTQTLLDQINPAGYLPYAQALTDQVNLFNRQVALRILDPRSDQMGTGWWGDVSDQMHIGSTPVSGTREGIFGFTGGFDVSGSNWVAGAALGFSSATLRNGAQTLKGHNNAYMFGGYGAFHAGPLVATGQLTYDLGNVRTSKTLSLSYTTTTTAATSTTPATTSTVANNVNVTAKPGDHLLKASATVGFQVNAGLVQATPFVGVDYARGAINTFTESNADAADLTVARIGIDRTDLLAGANITTNSGLFRPYLRAAYRDELGSGQGSTLSAFFDDDPNASFTVTGTKVGRQEADIDAGVNVVYDDGIIFVGYQGTIRKGMSDHGLHAGVRVPF